MAWNDSGGGNNRDPWSGGGGNNEGPPDLDEILRRAKARLNGIFGGKGGSGSGSDSSGGGGIGNTGIAIIVAVVVIGWGLSGIYIVDEGERGAVRLFGEHTATTEPGPHWRWPYPIGAVQHVNVSRRRSIDIGSIDRVQSSSRASQDESIMLTADENLVSVNMEVQYRVADAKAYLYNFEDPDQTLKDISVSALREVVGGRKLSELLTAGGGELDATFAALQEEVDLSQEEVDDLREQSTVAEDDPEQQEEPETVDLVNAIRGLVTEHVDKYGVGLQIVEVNVGRARPPGAVQDAFDDAVRAREDMRRLIQEAIAYKNQQVPKARGRAARLDSDAKSYAAEKTNEAEGAAKRFLALNKEYQRAPEVTRDRLYLQTMQSVLSETDKILVDTEGNSPLMHMPINGVLNRSGSRSMNAAGDSASSSDASSESNNSSQQVSSTTPGSDGTRESY